jgi:hypothetical protein
MHTQAMTSAESVSAASSLSSVLKTSALKACRHFMLPIARFLLRNGIGYKEFAEISKLAFVQVASEDYGLRGRRTNMSRISVMTGINRKEIRKLRDRLEAEDWAPNPALSKPAAVLGKWFNHPRYLGPKGTPKWLVFEAQADRESFTQLVREVGGDVPPGAMLKELVRAGCVKEARPGYWKAVKRQFSPSGVDLFQVQRFGECLHDLAQTIVTNMEQEKGEKRLFEFRAWSDKINHKAIDELRQIVASQGNAYLEGIDDWLEAHASREEADGEIRRRCGVGLYYFETPPSNSRSRRTRR